MTSVDRGLRRRGGSCDASRPKFLFKIKTSEGKLSSRSMQFKLAYARKARNKVKEGFGPKSCKNTKICSRKTNYAFWNAYMLIIMCITMFRKYLRNLVNTWQSAEVPTLANHIPESDAKVKITPETCRRDRKCWDKSNKNFWNTYGYILTAIRLIGIFLTKQASRLKWITLQMTNSCLVKEYTLVKIGANSCPMVEKPLHKSHSKFRNSHSYLEWRILGFKEYLHTLMEALETHGNPLWERVYKEDRNPGISEWS